MARHRAIAYLIEHPDLRRPLTAKADLPVSSIRVTTTPGSAHATVTIWSRGALAGSLTLHPDDVPLFTDALLPNGVFLDAE